MSAAAQLIFPPQHGSDSALPARPAPAPHAGAETAFRGFLQSLGLDTADPHLADTPARVARAYAELFAGLDDEALPRLTTFPNTGSRTAMIVLAAVPFYSMCAHHFLPFFGRAHIGYVPGERLVGLSKLARALEYYARRPQVQERLTEETASLLIQETGAAGVAVLTEARHLCMEMRGISTPGAVTSTLALRGTLEEQPLKQEFFERVRASRSLPEV